MVITYHGGACFKITSGQSSIVFNPPAKGSRFPEAKFGADVALVSLHHADFNGVGDGSKFTHVIEGPGEYEMGELAVIGYGVETIYDETKHFNTIYQLRLEGSTILFLGVLGTESIDPQILSEIDDIDILFLPIGGGDVLSVPQAVKLATKLEPHCIIPMQYEKDDLALFLKEAGAEETPSLEKLTVKKKDIAEMENKIISLKN